MAERNDNLLQIEVTGLGDTIPAESYLELVRSALHVLGEIDLSISQAEKPALDWQIVSASLNSPMLLAIEGMPAEGVNIGRKVIHAYVGALQALEQGVVKKPKYFTDAALYKVKNLISVLNGGIRNMRFITADGISVSPSIKVAETVDELLPDAAEQDDLIEGIDVQNDKSKARTEERATLVGKLEGLDVHGSQPVFHVYDPLSGKKVRCLFDKEKLGYAKESLPHRVSVTGTATYNNKGQIVSIKVIHFRKLRSRNELPQASDLEGIDLTGGIDPTEYVRRLRDA